MLNLLFISDSPKIENIKTALQPVLKVIIDVVVDFDQGLKNVFEKRPATVCIQEQIGGVTGESVARHIQMLLGNNAPTFILLHSAGGNAKPLKGLYEHLIDIDQPYEAVAENIINTLKSLLGEQWNKIYIAPIQEVSSLNSAASLPNESRENADKLVDDLLSDIEKSDFSPTYTVSEKLLNIDATSDADSNKAAIEVESEQKDVLGTLITDKIQTSSDEIADLLLAEAKKTTQESKPVVETPNVSVAYESAPAVDPPPVIPKTVTASVKTVKSEPISPPQVKDFVIEQKTQPIEEPIPEELLLAFEDNYRTESKFSNVKVVIAIVLLLAAGGGWYFYQQNFKSVGKIKQKVATISAKPTNITNAKPAASVNKPASPSVPAVTAAGTIVLPSFIPKEGLDSSYSAKNPGWERYLGKQAEFRIFKASGKIKAVQILSLKNEIIPDSFITSVLNEVAGGGKYKITSSKIKSGVRIESGKIQDKGDIMIYKKNGTVKAIVVAVN